MAEATSFYDRLLAERAGRGHDPVGSLSRWAGEWNLMHRVVLRGIGGCHAYAVELARIANAQDAPALAMDMAALARVSPVPSVQAEARKVQRQAERALGQRQMAR